MRRLASCSLFFLLACPSGLLAAEPAEVSALRAKAEKGNSLAQYNLGLAYSQGQLVTVDLPEAFAWLTLAAENGSTGNALDRVLGGLTDEQLAEGRRRLAAHRTVLSGRPTGAAAGRPPARRPANRGFSLTPMSDAPSTEPDSSPAAPVTRPPESTGLLLPARPEALGPGPLPEARSEVAQLRDELAQAQERLREQAATIAKLQAELALQAPAAPTPAAPRP